MDVVSIAATVGLAASATGLANVIWANIRHTMAERKLKRELRKDGANSIRLKALTQDLVNNPDPVKVEEARQILSKLADKLDKSDRSDILAILDRRSDQSKANYISKLVETEKVSGNSSD
jgi:hypothetical protein